MTTTAGPTRTPPDLLDVARSVWRWRVGVAAAAVLGLAFGALVLPSASASTESRATVRVDVRPLPSAIEPTAKGPAAARGGQASDPAERFRDVAAMGKALTAIGPSAAQLDAVDGAVPADRPRRAVGALQAAPLAGSNVVRFSFDDSDPQLAGLLARRYSEAFAKARNDGYAAEQARLVAVARADAKVAYDGVLKLSRRADGERAVSGVGVTTTTQVLLDLAVTDYAAKSGRVDTLTAVGVKSFVPTRVAPGVDVQDVGSSPGRGLLALLGLLLGLAIGIGAAVVRDGVRNTVDRSDDLALLARTPVLAAVPNRGRAARGVTVVDQPGGAAADALNAARLALEVRGLGHDVRVLAATSPGSGDGRTTVVLNLAASLVADGHDVVVVCADLRHRQVEEYYRLGDEPGLTDLLLSESRSVRSALQQVAPGLHVLAGGHAGRGPGELLRPDRLMRVFGDLKDWGIVLVDAPDGSAAEAASVVAACDGVVVVARAGHTRRDAVAALADRMDGFAQRVMGIVLLGRGAVGGRQPRRRGAVAEWALPATDRGAAPEASAKVALVPSTAGPQPARRQAVARRSLPPTTRHQGAQALADTADV